MIKRENLDKTSAWPFIEARKMLRERKSFIEKKGKITLQTGYGPSGLPHIGTFGEVARTSMVGWYRYNCNGNYLDAYNECWWYAAF